MSTLLLIEDDEIFLETLRYNLEQSGFYVETASDGIAGLNKARQLRPDLIILDVMLPKLDGFSVCSAIAHEMAVPIILLTALSDESNIVAGLELGATDYVVKPFSVRELLARIRALLRWNERQAHWPVEGELVIGPLRLDRRSRQAWYNEQSLTLSPKEFDLLTYMMLHVGAAISRDTLLEQVWGSDFVGSYRTIDVHVRWLREKIEPNPSEPRIIQTVRGVGYRLHGLVDEPDEPH